MHFSATLHDSHYLLELSPLLLLGPAAVLLALLVFAVLAFEKPLAWLGAVLLGALGVGAFLLLAPAKQRVPTFSMLFADAEAFVRGASVAGGVAVVLALIALFAHRSTALRVLSGLAVVLGSLGEWHSLAARSTMRTSWWKVPVLRTLPLEGHVGRSMHVSPTWGTQLTLSCSTFIVFDSCKTLVKESVESPPGCEATSMPITFAERGTQPVELKGHCHQGPLTLTVKRAAEATTFDAREDPRFPLAVGHRWHYALSEQLRHAALLWGLVPGPNVKSPTFARTTLTITRALEAQGFQAFELTVSSDERLTREVLVAADGELFMLRDGVRVPAIEARPNGLFFAPLGVEAQWQSGPGRLAGPASWVQSSDFGPGHLLTVVFTLGLAIPPVRTTVWELVETQQGS